MKCAVFGCNSDNKRQKELRGIVMFYRFPTNPDLVKSWRRACCRADNFNTAHARICSLHFNKDDLLRNLQHELLGYKPRNCRRIKPTAIPSENLPRKSPFSCISTSPRYQKDETRNLSKLTDKLVEACKDAQGDEETQEETENNSSSITLSPSNFSGNSLYDSKSLLSDSDGFNGTAKKYGAVLRMMHNYSTTPQKLKEAVTQLRSSNQQLKNSLRTERVRTAKLKKNVQDLKNYINDITTALKKRQEVLEQNSYSDNADIEDLNQHSQIKQEPIEFVAEKLTEEFAQKMDEPSQENHSKVYLHNWVDGLDSKAFTRFFNNIQGAMKREDLKKSKAPKTKRKILKIQKNIEK